MIRDKKLKCGNIFCYFYGTDTLYTKSNCHNADAGHKCDVNKYLKGCMAKKRFDELKDLIRGKCNLSDFDKFGLWVYEKGDFLNKQVKKW